MNVDEVAKGLEAGNGRACRGQPLIDPGSSPSLRERIPCSRRPPSLPIPARPTFPTAQPTTNPRSPLPLPWIGTHATTTCGVSGPASFSPPSWALGYSPNPAHQPPLHHDPERSRMVFPATRLPIVRHALEITPTLETTACYLVADHHHSSRRPTHQQTTRLP